MAELAAFSLAANIFQFIDFGSRMTTKFFHFYRSSRDGRAAMPDIERLTSGLQKVLSDLAIPSKEAIGQDEELRDLALECQNVATILRDRLKSLTLDDGATKCEAIKAGWKLLWKEEEILLLQRRLDRFRGQLVMSALTSLRRQSTKTVDQQVSVLEKVNTVLQTTQRLEEKLAAVITSQDGCFGSLFLDALVSKAHPLEAVEQGRSLLRDDLIAAVLRDDDESACDEVSLPEINDRRRTFLRHKFLSRLKYEQIQDRMERIAEAHEKTFRWVFEEEDTTNLKWSDFAQWLRSDSQLYWVTGKAGSGKSTLMKFMCQSTSTGPETAEFLAQESRCTPFLKTWAGDCRLLTATFFFWNSGGVALQMTQSGLLRTLLIQILSQAPDLIPLASRGRWEAMCLFDAPLPYQWTDHELQQMLRSTVTRLPQDTKLCLFIDGLDEFEGDHTILVSLVKDLIKYPNVKMCVASRPWELFEDAFMQSPSMMLQDVTYEDIKAFTSSQLHTDPAFALLQEREPEYAAALVETVVSKASGVFLWVRLVVSSLIGGMLHGDRITDLQQRLDLLPPELEQLYDRMLSSLDPFYFSHAAQLFRLVDESMDPPPLLLMSFADEDACDFVKDRPLQPLTEKEAFMRWDTMRRRLNSRSKGFLEAAGPLEATSTARIQTWTVQHLHRTVKDYLKSSMVQQRLQAAISPEFDAHLNLFAGSLAQLKSIRIASTEDFCGGKISTFWMCITRCLYSASRVTSENSGPLVTLMDELDRTASLLVRNMAGIFADEAQSLDETAWLCDTGQWVGLHPNLRKVPFGDHFLSLAVRYGVTAYVAVKAPPRCVIQKVSSFDLLNANLLDPTSNFVGQNAFYPLLLDALSYSPDWSFTFHDSVPNLDMVNCLLAKGARFNAAWSFCCLITPWRMLLKQCAATFNEAKAGRLKLDKWQGIADLALKQGCQMIPDSEFAPLLTVLGESMIYISDQDLEQVRWFFALRQEQLLGPKLPSGGDQFPRSDWISEESKQGSWFRWPRIGLFNH